MNEISADLILDTALELAESSSWEKLHLYRIASRLDISLDQIRRYFPQKDDLVEAWFDRADSAVLQFNPSSEFLGLAESDRLEHVIMIWFDRLSFHHRITRQMMAYKLEFGHLHLQVQGIMRVSRTVQWFREAARLETTGLCRILGETVVTSIYLLTFVYWVNDVSPGQVKTRAFLRRHLKRAERISRVAVLHEV
jgi:ubiquinone biosynthesis protein COQ9